MLLCDSAGLLCARGGEGTRWMDGWMDGKAEKRKRDEVPCVFECVWACGRGAKQAVEVCN